MSSNVSAMIMENAHSVRFYAVTGRSGAGKTLFLAEIVKRATEARIRCNGFLQQRRTNHDLRTDEYWLIHATDQVSMMIARRRSDAKFDFVEKAFRQAKDWLQKDAAKAQLLVVDEFGRLEAEGGGHAPALKTVLSRHPGATVLISVRKSVLGEFRRRFHVAREQILDLDTERNTVEQFTQTLLAALRLPAAPAAGKLFFRSSRNDGSEKP